MNCVFIGQPTDVFKNFKFGFSLGNIKRFGALMRFDIGKKIVDCPDADRAQHFFRISGSIGNRGIQNYFLATQNPQNVRMEGCHALSRDELSRWDEYDLIISATFSDGYLISGGGKGCHVIIDLSVPRNVDPRLEQREGISLCNIEDIHRWIELKRGNCLQEIESSQQLLRSEVNQLAVMYREKTQGNRQLV